MNESFLQSEIWGAFRETQGWRAHKVGTTLVLERDLPFGKTFLYSPEVVATPELLLTLLPKVKEIAQRRNSIFYRLEVAVDTTSDLGEQWTAALGYTGLVKAFESVQPEHRQIVPLHENEAAMLKNMKQKGRYNIRLAERSGVLVRETTLKTLDDDIATFYKLMSETAKRDGFTTRPEAYFRELCATLYAHNCGKLFVATYQEQPLAAAIITHWGDTAAYLYGASSNQSRQLMAPYALHWTVMQWAAALELKYYDLLAIAPPKNPKHRYMGITRFKQQFGGDPVHYLGSWDLVFQPMWYTCFKTVEKARRRS